LQLFYNGFSLWMSVSVFKPFIMPLRPSLSLH